MSLVPAAEGSFENSFATSEWILGLKGLDLFAPAQMACVEGATILKWILVSETVGLVRLAIAEARRLPALASRVNRMARERGEEAVALLLREVAQSDELGKLPAFAPERLVTTTRFFLDLIVLPLFLRALYGEKLKVLHAEIGAHVARSVAFFVAGCRCDGVT